jgi:GTP-binding protein Era
MFRPLMNARRVFNSPQLNRTYRTVPKRVLPVPTKEKRLDIVILGAPNAGKSVLLNTMIKTQLAAATRKRHTTRYEILGVVNHRNTQLAIFDTPGFVKDSVGSTFKASSKQLSNIAEATVKEKADIVMLVVDAVRCRPANLGAFADMAKLALANAKMEVILVLNKVDLVMPKTNLLETTRTLVSIINGIKLGPGKQHLAILDTTTFMISATKNDGVIDIKNYLVSIAEFKPWIIPKDQGITDLTMEDRVEEMVLQQLMEHTHEKSCRKGSNTS